MTNMINEIISNTVLYSKNCSKLLEYDGISSRVFLLKGFDNKKLIHIKDVKILRSTIPSAGLALTLIKNFDEYQFIICNYVPRLNDDNIFKIKFQKIRILIFLFFYRLSQMMMEKKISETLDIWIKEANSLLVEVSQLILEFREYLQNSAANNSDSDLSLINNVTLKKDYFSFFNLDEKKIDKEILSIYGIDI
ncbi:MAG: hypothetical protein ACTHKJ_11050 [Candidatus Nitrosocosmicus sp.]